MSKMASGIFELYNGFKPQLHNPIKVLDLELKLYEIWKDSFHEHYYNNLISAEPDVLD